MGPNYNIEHKGRKQSLISQVQICDYGGLDLGNSNGNER